MADTLRIIKERQSVGGRYDQGKSISQQDLDQILEAAQWAPTAHNMQNYEIVVVNDKKVLEEISDIKFQISEAFVKETVPYISFSEEELQRKKIGALRPPTTAAPGAGMDEALQMSLNRSIGTCDTLLVVLYDPGKRAPGSEGDFLGIVSLGCLMENMWLMASSLGIGMRIVSSLSDVGDEVKSILGVPGKYRVAYACRLGYHMAGDPQHVRVRRDLEDFVHYNKY